MTNLFSNLCQKHGIAEIYFHPNFDYNLLKKLQTRAAKTLDCSDPIVRKHVCCDAILVFYKRIPTSNVIYRFFESLHADAEKEKNFIKENTLLNESELFAAIKDKTFVLVTHLDITSEYCSN